MSEYNWNQLMAEADQGIVPIPAGEYEMQVGTAVVAATGNGKDMIKVRYNVVAGPHIGRPVFNNFTISPESSQSMGFFFRQMKAHGLGPDFFGRNPTPQQVAENLVGKLVHVKIKIEPYQGEDRNKPDGFSPSQLPGGAATAVPAPAPLGAPAFPPMTAVPAPAPLAPLAPPVAPTLAPPVVAPPVTPAPVARVFDPASGMEVVNGAWAWPAEATAGYVWSQAVNAWVAPANAPVAPAPAPAAPPAPPMPPMPPAPPGTPSF
jgi:hypothetical protein